jgi:hypothetical protein
VNETERRAANPPRIPFVRRCWLELDQARVVGAFTVNLSSVGAYLTRADFVPATPGAPPPADELPSVGQAVTCRITMPDSENEVVVRGTVSWVNSRQQHPVHSLPPGFGLRFIEVGEDAKRRIEALVREYHARSS